MHILNENYKAISLLRPQECTDTVTGDGVDVGLAYNDDGLVVLDIGACSGADSTLIVTIQADDDVAFGTPTTVATFDTLGPTSDNKIAACAVSFTKRYLRAVATKGGVGILPSFVIGVTLLAQARRVIAALNSVTPA